MRCWCRTRRPVGHAWPGCSVRRRRVTPSAILFEIGKLTALRATGAHIWKLDDLAPNRRRLLSRIGQRATNQALKRMPPERRYPILLAFLHQAFDDITDEVVDPFGRCTGD
jgi:hypothetical protein